MLTPIEIQGKTFKNGRGYKKEEIDEFLRTVGRDYEVLYKENLEYKDKLSTLSEGLAYYKSIENTLQKALVLAEKTSNDTTNNAEKKAEAIETEARLKAENIEAEAKAEAEKILADSRKELSNLEMKMVSMAQEYEKYRAQCRQMAKAQIELLDGAAYQIDFKAQDINTEPLPKEKEEGISLFLKDAERVKKEKAGESDKKTKEPLESAAPEESPVKEEAVIQKEKEETVVQKEKEETVIQKEKEETAVSDEKKADETKEENGQTLNEIFERLKSKNDGHEPQATVRDGAPVDTTDVWTPEPQGSASFDNTFYQDGNMKFAHVKKENPAMEQTTDFEFIKEEDT